MRIGPVVTEVSLSGPHACMPADFDRQSAILIGVNELLPHHPQVLTALVRALIDRVPLIAVITGEEQRRDLLTTLCDWGLPAHRMRAVRSPAIGLWVRDYGPAFVRRDGRACALDARYWYPNRPDDDRFPAELARLIDVDVHDVPLTIEGGNLISNGRGLAVSSTVVLDRNKGVTPAQVLAVFRRHYGFESVALLPPLRGGMTDHSDMFATFTAPDTLVLGRYDPAEDAANAALLDRSAAAVLGVASGAGPLKVERIPMPPHRDGIWRTYTNAVYANDVVVVPTYAGVDERVEREALDTYRRLLPGREILTVEATSLARTGGALRCVTLNVPDVAAITFDLADAAGLAESPPLQLPVPADELAALEGVPPAAGDYVLGSGWYVPPATPRFLSLR